LRPALTRLLLIAAALGPALGGCGGDDGEDADDPSVSFVRPDDGAGVASTVTAEVALENFELDRSSFGRTNAEGKGNLHFSLDGGRFDDPTHAGPNGSLAFRLGTDGQYSPALAPTITYARLPPGEHTLRVELAENDHAALGVSDEVSFTVD